MTATSPTVDHATTRTAWPTTRILFLLAGSLTLVSVVLGAAVSPWFLLLAGLIGVNQLVFVTFGACPASLVIDRLRSIRTTS